MHIVVFLLQGREAYIGRRWVPNVALYLEHA